MEVVYSIAGPGPGYGLVLDEAGAVAGGAGFEVGVACGGLSSVGSWVGAGVEPHEAIVSAKIKIRQVISHSLFLISTPLFQWASRENYTRDTPRILQGSFYRMQDE